MRVTQELLQGVGCSLTVTVLGISTFTNASHREKAKSAILVAPLGIFTKRKFSVGSQPADHWVGHSTGFTGVNSTCTCSEGVSN